MLTFASETTTQYLNLYPKVDRKSKGQFFTCNSTAYFMSSLFLINKNHIKLLDPGAGTGILSVAAVETLITNNGINTIELDLFENDNTILPILKKNMEDLKKICQLKEKTFTYRIYNENFILFYSDFWNNNNYSAKYDAIISNPPYAKIGKNSQEAEKMKSIVYGQPNLYFLFMALSAKLLNKNGEMVFIIPRSWVSGLYFAKFREFFLSIMKITNMHLFVARDKVFKKENVLQEIIIIKAKKTKEVFESILMSTSNDSDEFADLRKFEIPYKICVDNKNKFIYLPTNEQEIKILKQINSFKNNLVSLGFKAKTGLVVDFRSKELLRKTNSVNTVPLIWPQNLYNGRVIYPNANVEQQYIVSTKKSLLMKNGNYLLLKRFTAKEEKRRLQAAILLPIDNDYISTENHLNFIVKKNGSNISEEEMWGLYTIFNSTIWDKYFRILNGSTQVNSNELNSLALPELEIIRKLGIIARTRNSYSTQDSDSIIKEYIQWEN